MQNSTKRRFPPAWVFVMFFVLFSAYIMNMYQKNAMRHDEEYFQAVKDGQIPQCLRGVSLIEIDNGNLRIVFNPPYSYGESFTHHKDYVSQKLNFKQGEILRDDNNISCAYGDPQALRSVLIYSLVIGTDLRSKYEENLFLESFDGREAKFLVLIAVRREKGYSLILKKVFAVSETYISAVEKIRMKNAAR